MVRRPSLEQKRAPEHSALSPFCLAALPAGRLGRLVYLPGWSRRKEQQRRQERKTDGTKWFQHLAPPGTGRPQGSTCQFGTCTPTGRKCSLKAFLVQEKRGGRAGRTRTTVARALWENPRPRFRGEFFPRGNGAYLIENKMLRLAGGEPLFLIFFTHSGQGVAPSLRFCKAGSDAASTTLARSIMSTIPPPASSTLRFEDK